MTGGHPRLDATLRRDPDILQVDVADGLLLVDPSRIRAHGLNSSAAIIWRELVDPARADEVTDRVAERVGLASGSVRAEIATTIDRLVDEGLVSRGSPSPVALGDTSLLPGRFANVPSTDEAVPDGHHQLDWVAHHGPFRGLDVTFDLTSTDVDLGRYLAAVWSPLAVAPGEFPATPVRHYRITGSHPDPAFDHLASLDGRVIGRSHADSALAGLLVWHANQLVSTETDRLLQLHASAVTIDGRAVLLPAEMNSGKSTLATALVAAGAGYLTDETVAVDPITGDVVPYPKAVTLDPGSWDLFPGLEPPIQRELPRLAHAKWYVDPDAVRPASRSGPAPPGAIVYPTFAPDRPTTLVPIAPVSAAAQLARHSFNLQAMGQRGVDLIARLATTVACSELSVHDLDSGIAAIHRAAAEAGARRPV